MAPDDSTLLYPVASLGRGRIGATLPRRARHRREAHEPATRAKRRDERVEEYGHFLIKPDRACRECAEIMLWRSTHRFIAITDEAEIRVSDTRWGSRHLHVRDVRIAHLTDIEEQRKERKRKEGLHLVAS